MELVHFSQIYSGFVSLYKMLLINRYAGEMVTKFVFINRIYRKTGHLYLNITMQIFWIGINLEQFVQDCCADTL